MKKLFLALFIPIAVILGTPALVATLMYDGTGNEHLPVHLYNDDAEDALTMLFSELDTSISEVEDGTSGDLEFNLHQDIINRAIYEAILEQNPDYAPGDDCVTDDECYIAAEPVVAEGYEFSFRIVGIWVSFYDGSSSTDPGRFVFNVFLEVDLNGGMQYKTVVEAHFLFDDDADYYYLEFDKVQIGRLPLPKSFFTSIINVVQEQANIDLEAQLGEIPLGEFDIDNLSYTIQKDEILTKMVESENGEPESGALLGQGLLSIVFENQLVQFDLQDDEFVLTVGVSKFRSEDEGDTDIPAYLYTLHDQEMIDGEVVIGEFNPELFNPEAYLQDLFTEYVFNSSLLGGGFKIKESTFNKLIYSGAEGFADTRQTVDIPISETETKTIELGLKAIWFEFEADQIYAKVLFRIAGIDSLIVIRAEEVSITGDILQFEFVEITAGKDVGENSGDYLEILDLEVFKQAFAALGDVEFGEFNAEGDLIISADKLSVMLQDGSEDGVVIVTGISLEENAIVLTVEAADPTLQATLTAFQDALTDVIGDEQLLTDLGTVLDTTDGGTEQAVYESMVDLQATLADPEATVQPEQLEELFTNFEQLDSATQEAFLESITDLVDPSVFANFEDLFGSLGDETVPPVE